MQGQITDLAPHFVDGKPIQIAGLRQTHVGSNAGIAAQWMRFAPHIGKIPGEVEGAAYGICFDLCQGGGEGFDYIAGVEVAQVAGGAADLPPELSPLSLPAQRYAVFQHTDHVSTLPATIDAIWRKWLPGSGQEPAGDPAFFERYGEAFDPLTGRGGVEVWVPLKG